LLVVAEVMVSGPAVQVARLVVASPGSSATAAGAQPVGSGSGSAPHHAAGDRLAALGRDRHDLDRPAVAAVRDRRRRAELAAHGVAARAEQRGRPGERIHRDAGSDRPHHHRALALRHHADRVAIGEPREPEHTADVGGGHRQRRRPAADADRHVGRPGRRRAAAAQRQQRHREHHSLLHHGRDGTAGPTWAQRARPGRGTPISTSGR
jgi:hypothetical protein